MDTQRTATERKNPSHVYKCKIHTSDTEICLHIYKYIIFMNIDISYICKYINIDG